jgi:cation transport ATPase
MDTRSRRLILISFLLAFPGALAPGEVIGGLQSTSWLYAVWHGGLAMFVTVYALLKDEDTTERRRRGSAGASIMSSVAATTATVFVVAVLTLNPKRLGEVFTGARFPFRWARPQAALLDGGWHIPAALTLGMQSTTWHSIEHASSSRAGLLSLR